MGRVEVVIERIESAALEGNAAGDPHVRRVPVVLPPSYADASRRFPVVYLLSGYTGRGLTMLNDVAWGEPIDQRLERLIASGACEEMILVLPDCFTRFGGSQYLDSSATGRYAHHLVSELVPWIDARYRTLATREHRGVAGKSSGGYGALIHGMRHPDVFGAVASHSGDVYFEYCYRKDVPMTAAAILAAGGLRKWMEAFEAKRQKRREDLDVLNIVAMAASYSPDPAAELGIALPFDPATGEFRDAVWARWLEQDPYPLASRHADALRSLKLLFIDCGHRDEFYLHLGARMLSRRLRSLGVPHEHEEFDDGHMNVQYRWDVSLPKLGRALARSATVRA